MVRTTELAKISWLPFAVDECQVLMFMNEQTMFYFRYYFCLGVSKQWKDYNDFRSLSPLPGTFEFTQ